MTITLGIVSSVSAVVIVALIGTLIIVLQHGASSGTSSGELQPGAASAQTATASSVQASATAEGTPAASATGTTTMQQSTPAPRPTATPAGPPSVHVLSRQVTGKTNAPLTVSCPSGELALSGGWSSSLRGVPLGFSKRSGNGWQVLINTLKASLAPTTTVYVVCLRHVTGASVTQRQYQTPINEGDYVSANAQCNPGELVVGGGGENPAGLTISAFAPLKSNLGFAASVSNNTGTGLHAFITYVECLKAMGAQTAYGSSSQADVSSGASVGVQATCLAGALIASGGVSITQIYALYAYSPSDSSTWQAHVANLGTTAGKLILSPWCLSFS